MLPQPAVACGTPDTVCTVAGGTYRLALPETVPEGGVPAVFHLHGWGASAAAAMGRKPRRDAILARGTALIVPDGVPRGGRHQRDWDVRDPGTHPRDDIAFFRQVLADAARRGVDPGRVLLSGFSRGGSMVWDVACQAPGLFRAYAPLAGAFWEPLPAGCSSGVDLFHTHGWADSVVPIEGRPVAGGRLIQADLFAALAILREALDCPSDRADRTGIRAQRWTRDWACPDGQIRLMLHPGGHGAPEGWTASILDWFHLRLTNAPVSAAD